MVKKRKIYSKKEWLAKGNSVTQANEKQINATYKGLLSSIKKDLELDAQIIKQRLLLSIETDVMETIEKTAKRLIKKRIESFDEQEVKPKTIKKAVYGK
jgi:hypothetical protein